MQLKDSRKLVAGLVIAFLLAAGSLSATDLRITTWNLNWFPNGNPKDAPAAEKERRIHAAADVLRALNPDIILLQEVRDYETAARLAEAIKPGAYQIAICSAFKDGFQPGLGKQQVVILAREPAQAAWAEPWKSMQGVGPPRGFAFAWFKIKGVDVGIYCVHLKSNLILRGDKAAEQAKNIRKREVASQQLLDHIQTVVAQKMPMVRSFIIGGDFNTNTDEFAGETTLTKLEQGGFQNSMDGLASTMRVTHPGGHGYPDTTFDYLFAKGATIGKPMITRSEASDHLPVTCDVTLGATGVVTNTTTTAQPPTVATNGASEPATPSVPLRLNRPLHLLSLSR